MINRHPSDCRCCTSPALAVPAEPEPIDLPTPIRVHSPGAPPMDCTLHPDGTLTRIAVNGELQRNFMTFEDMRERNWRHARIEFNPGPLPEPASGPTAVQGVIEL